jgi:hypothetical protein
VALKGGKVLVSDGITKKPLLVNKGNAYFSTIGFAPEATAYFVAAIRSMVRVPVSLEGSTGLRFLETVQKDNAVCVSCFKEGEARLRVDAADLGVEDATLEVRNILTGKTLHTVSAAKLAEGVAIGIKHLDEPCVLAIGAPAKLAGYRGIYPPEEDFSGMTELLAIENPQVPIMVPNAPGIKVGIYHSGLAAPQLVEMLRKDPGINAFSLPRLDHAALGACDVLFLPQSKSAVHIRHAGTRIRQFVEKGGGLLLTHAALGYRLHTGEPLVPEVGKGGPKIRYRHARPKSHRLTFAKTHPVTAGFTVGDAFTPAFQFDHITIEKGAEAETLIENDKGDPVLVAGSMGRGRAVLSGMLPGWQGEQDDPGGRPGPVTETERRLLVNTIKWLAAE